MGDLKIQMEKALQRNFTEMVKQPLCRFQFEKNQPAAPGAERLRSYMQRLHHYVQGRKAKESQETPECHLGNVSQPNT